MKLKFSKINGTNADLDYESLKASIINKLTPTCKEAEVIILNNFPVSISAQSSLDFIFLLNIPKVEKSWYNADTVKDRIPVRNQIIAVSIINEYYDSSIKLNGSFLEVDGNYIDLQDDASKMKWGLTNYLSNNCGLDRKYITIQPVIWIRNSSLSKISNNILIDKEFTYNKVEEVLTLNSYFKWAGYKDWYYNDMQFDFDIQKIFEQASRDSKDGYVTKKKIIRIQSKLDQSSAKAYDNIGKKLVEVKGKAGTGKSSDILKWMMRLSLEGQKGVFLTYNKVLVFDISAQIQHYINTLAPDIRRSKKPTTTYTLHYYFYGIAKKLGVLLLLTEQRVSELSMVLDSRWIKIESYFNYVREAKGNINLEQLMMSIQNDWDEVEGVKREAILFIQHIERLKLLPDKNITEGRFNEYRKYKLDKLSNLESSNIFLKDYHKVLERILQATINLDKFISDLDVVSKFDLLSNVMNLKEDILDKDGSGNINLEKLKTRYKKSLGAFRANRIAYIDEAQDCHPLERDIIFGIFGSNNVVIANGDREQLIRYSQRCDWYISKGQKIDYYRFQKRRKSYRMKPAIAALSNHIANWFGINLNIEPLETEDHGSVILDSSSSSNKQVEILKYLKTIGERQGCTNYESLLLLASSESSGDFIINSVKVNEHDNIINEKTKAKSEWPLIEAAKLEIGDASFWNLTGNVDKRKLGAPGSLSLRSIYYESCRGIEAWSIMCFQLDHFYEHKFKEKDADNYLLNDLFDQLTPEKRKAMYAATWVLMAITRGMENCYINLSNYESELSKAILSFSEKYPHYVKRIE
jgi:hypothetical protein